MYLNAVGIIVTPCSQVDYRLYCADEKWEVMLYVLFALTSQNRVPHVAVLNITLAVGRTLNSINQTTCSRA